MFCYEQLQFETVYFFQQTNTRGQLFIWILLWTVCSLYSRTYLKNHTSKSRSIHSKVFSVQSFTGHRVLDLVPLQASIQFYLKEISQHLFSSKILETFWEHLWVSASSDIYFLTQSALTGSKSTIVYKICSKLSIKRPERRHLRRCSVFIVNYEHISNIVIVFPFLSLNK